MGLLTDVHGRGLLSARPAAGHGGREYFATDTKTTYRDNGSSWDAEATGGVIDTGGITYLDATVAAAPATPASGALRIYAKTGKTLAVKDDAGLETVLGQGIADHGAFTYLDATDGAAPANPAAGHARVYSKAGRIYSRDSSGVESGPFDAAGAGAGPLLYADSLTAGSIHDSFASAALAAWTFGGGMSSADAAAVLTEPYDATCLDLTFTSAGYRMYQAWPGGDGIAYLTWHGVTNSTPASLAALGAMIALVLTDNSGNGTGISCYDDGKAYMWAVAANAYSSTGNVLTSAATPMAGYAASNRPAVYRLEKVGSTITGALSYDGGVSWVTANRTDSTTFTRVGLTRLFVNGGTAPKLRVGRFNNA